MISFVCLAQAVMTQIQYFRLAVYLYNSPNNRPINIIRCVHFVENILPIYFSSALMSISDNLVYFLWFSSSLSILNLALGRTGIPMGCNKTLDHVQTCSKSTQKDAYKGVSLFYSISNAYNFVLLFHAAFSQVFSYLCANDAVVSDEVGGV